MKHDEDFVGDALRGARGAAHGGEGPDSSEDVGLSPEQDTASPTLDEAAYYGIVGEIVRTIFPTLKPTRLLC
jgi:hypothetical protein